MVNNEIKAKEIRLITENKNEILSTKKAIKIAEEEGLDLICISPNAEIPVCKIGNYSKYLYEQKKREKENKKKQKPVETKEIQIGDYTEINDLRTKAKMIDKFLKNKNKVKLSIRYKGRAVAHIANGPEKLNDLTKLITGEFVIDCQPKTAGNVVYMIISPKN